MRVARVCRRFKEVGDFYLPDRVPEEAGARARVQGPSGSMWLRIA
jgi:hypothetical protein